MPIQCGACKQMGVKCIKVIFNVKFVAICVLDECSATTIRTDVLRDDRSSFL